MGGREAWLIHHRNQYHASRGVAWRAVLLRLIPHQAIWVAVVVPATNGLFAPSLHVNQCKLQQGARLVLIRDDYNELPRCGGALAFLNHPSLPTISNREI